MDLMFSQEVQEGCSLSTYCRLTKDGKRQQKEGLEDQDKLSALQGNLKIVFLLSGQENSCGSYATKYLKLGTSPATQILLAYIGKISFH